MIPAPDPAALLAFAPVPRKVKRADGWTPERQRDFIAALAECGSVTAAARRVNMCHATAYDLYNHPEGASFRAAWDQALALGIQRLHDVAMERAMGGVASPVFYKGEQVGERRQYNDHLLGLLLRHHAFGAQDGSAAGKSQSRREREAAEICPVCRDRRIAEEEAEANAPSEAEASEEFATQLFELYLGKMQQERKERLAGRPVSADFYLRQLTQLELSLEAAGHTLHLVELWTTQASPYGRHDLQPTECGAYLASLREAWWAEMVDPPRPILPVKPGSQRDAGVYGGPTIMARHAAQAEAQARIAAAQAQWEAAGNEHSWATWCAERDGTAPAARDKNAPVIIDNDATPRGPSVRRG